MGGQLVPTVMPQKGIGHAYRPVPYCPNCFAELEDAEHARSQPQTEVKT